MGASTIRTAVTGPVSSMSSYRHARPSMFQWCSAQHAHGHIGTAPVRYSRESGPGAAAYAACMSVRVTAELCTPPECSGGAEVRLAMPHPMPQQPPLRGLMSCRRPPAQPPSTAFQAASAAVTLDVRMLP